MEYDAALLEAHRMVVHHRLHAAIGVAITGWFFGCGGDSNSIGGNIDGGSTTSPGCQLPACYYDFVNSTLACAPMGECVQQNDVTAMESTSHMCYANGTKVVMTSSQTTLSSSNVITGSDGKICYLVNGTVTIDPVTGVVSLAMATILNADGNVIATIGADRSITATCAGESAKTVPASCNVTRPGDMASACTIGTCM